MSLAAPSSIAASNVLWGIASPVCTVRNRAQNQKAVETTITFDTEQHFPPQIIPVPDDIRVHRYKSGEIKQTFRIRMHFLFRYNFLTAVEAAKWISLLNYHMNGFELVMRPHNDDGLKLEWVVVPDETSEFKIGYFAEKYIGHTLELRFYSTTLDSAVSTRSSIIHHDPAITLHL